nr:FAD-dependent urate hydroxylase-like [Ipomoea batatas]
MTPDIGQGGCSALEDSVILARHLGEALLLKSGDEELRRIRYGLDRSGYFFGTSQAGAEELSFGIVRVFKSRRVWAYVVE